MKSEDLSKFNGLVIQKITDLLSSHHRSAAPTDEREIVSLALKLDSPEVNELLFALGRIEKGIFGQCVICRHDIPIEILEGELAARLCPSCQTALLERNDSAR